MLMLNDGRSELWQWDTGRKLTVDADCSQVHFSNKVFGRSIDVDVVDGVASIPDVLLQTDKDLTAWAFVGTAENGYTKISKVFKVNKRNKPADYVFTPTDQTTLNEILDRIEDLENRPIGDVSKEDIQNAVSDYFDENPLSVVEKDPTVPDWAKQPQKPRYTAAEVGAQPEGNYVKTVNGETPDENGNIQIKTTDFGQNAILYTPQELTEEQKAQARENIGAMPEDAVITLSKEQVNALDALFKVASYNEDASAAYKAFCDAFCVVDQTAVVVKDIKFGVVGFDNGKMSLNTEARFAHRATAIPIGMYLKNGKTYRFSIGSLGSVYKFGFKVYAAPAPDMEFPYVNNGSLNFYDVTEMIYASGWITTEESYTVYRDNCILAVNFACVSGRNFTESDYAVILENFVIE